MPSLRAVPPVHSPITLAAVASGLAAMTGGEARARAEVTEALTRSLAPRSLLLTDSGTSALTLALRAAATLAPGPAALPAYCCYDIATAADGAGVEVLLYDLDPETLGPDFASLERVLAQGARTVVVVHLYGIPLDLPEVQRVLGRYRAVLIEDAAQGAGAACDGRPLGSIGAFGVLSFGRGKGITGGRGGALLANDERAATALATVREGLRPARTSASEPIAVLAQWLLARPSLYGIPASLPFLGLGETIYRRPEEPRAMSPFALGVLSHTLADADREAHLRRSHASRLLARAAMDSGLLRTAQAPVSAVAGYLRLPLLLPDEWRARYGSPAAKRLGIMPGYPTTLAELAGFTPRVRNAGVAFPGARRLVTSLVTLPTHGRVSERDLRALERWIAGRD